VAVDRQGVHVGVADPDPGGVVMVVEFGVNLKSGGGGDRSDE
jgi:hypothetical protein